VLQASAPRQHQRNAGALAGGFGDGIRARLRVVCTSAVVGTLAEAATSGNVQGLQLFQRRQRMH